jgi:ligand-binding sensor domain-containing protein
MSIFFKVSGLILFSVFSGILFYSCENEKTHSVNKFPATRLMSLFIDPSGIVWAGTDVGIISYFEGAWTSYKNITNLPEGDVSEIEFRNDNNNSEIWMATSTGVIAANYTLDMIIG